MCEGWADWIIRLGKILDEWHQTVEGTQGEARMVSWAGHSLEGDPRRVTRGDDPVIHKWP